jgi:hypothetical protein
VYNVHRLLHVVCYQGTADIPSLTPPRPRPTAGKYTTITRVLVLYVHVQLVSGTTNVQEATPDLEDAFKSMPNIASWPSNSALIHGGSASGEIV